MRLSQIDSFDWKRSHFKHFWTDIAANEHLVQFYENERTFLNTLEGFAGTGLLAGDSVIIIATSDHLNELNERLCAQGFDITRLQAQGRYHALKASDMLGKFMGNEMPDGLSFRNVIGNIYERAAHNGLRVRAFGEMVAVLWEKGQTKASRELERAWNTFLEKKPLSLFCAYPRRIFRNFNELSVSSVCSEHSKVIAGWPHASTEVYYSELT